MIDMAKRWKWWTQQRRWTPAKYCGTFFPSSFWLSDSWRVKRWATHLFNLAGKIGQANSQWAVTFSEQSFTASTSLCPFSTTAGEWDCEVLLNKLSMAGARMTIHLAEQSSSGKMSTRTSQSFKRYHCLSRGVISKPQMGPFLVSKH